jgi:hypothetical protein
MREQIKINADFFIAIREKGMEKNNREKNKYNCMAYFHVTSFNVKDDDFILHKPQL